MSRQLIALFCVLAVSLAAAVAAASAQAVDEMSRVADDITALLTRAGLR